MGVLVATTKQWCLSSNTKSSKIPCIMDLLRAITLFTLQHNFTLTAVHLAGLKKGVADSLFHF